MTRLVGGTNTGLLWPTTVSRGPSDHAGYTIRHSRSSRTGIQVHSRFAEQPGGISGVADEQRQGIVSLSPEELAAEDERLLALVVSLESRVADLERRLAEVSGVADLGH
jgi:hypothetical protein